MLKQRNTKEQEQETEIGQFPVAEETAPVPVETPSPDELGRLRDILFGSQSRTYEKRLGDLETGLKTTRQEITDLISDSLPYKYERKSVIG